MEERTVRDCQTFTILESPTIYADEFDGVNEALQNEANTGNDAVHLWAASMLKDACVTAKQKLSIVISAKMIWYLRLNLTTMMPINPLALKLVKVAKLGVLTLLQSW